MESELTNIYELRECKSEEDFEKFDKVQISIFIEEQNFDRDAVMDKNGDLKFYNFYVNETHVGSIRHNHKKKGYKVQRVGILKEFRKKGYGKKMLMSILKEIKKVIKEEEIVYSEIQAHTLDFYLSCGFNVDVDNPMIIQNTLHYNATLKF